MPQGRSCNLTFICILVLHMSIFPTYMSFYRLCSPSFSLCHSNIYDFWHVANFTAAKLTKKETQLTASTIMPNTYSALWGTDSCDAVMRKTPKAKHRKVSATAFNIGFWLFLVHNKEFSWSFVASNDSDFRKKNYMQCTVFFFAHKLKQVLAESA